jgi:hypothetical protein
MHIVSALIAIAVIGSSASIQAVTPPIPFTDIGAKATADYHGDAIGVAPAGEGARLHTAFQKLSGSITRDGLWLNSTEAEGGQLHLVASAIGETKLPSRGTVAIRDNVVSFKRRGLTEEYSVSVDGVRQDFVVSERPADVRELTVALELSGAKAESAAYGVKLTLDGSGRELAYGRLRVSDATGRKLPATIKVLTANRLAVHVADNDAVYPVRIDPIFSDADWVSLNSGIPGTNGIVGATVVDGSGNLYIGGSFTFVGNVAANNIAKWNGSAWSALGSGMNAGVGALAVSGTTIYAGGGFTTAGGVSANRIAQWNGTAWSALGQGMDPNGPGPFTLGDSGVYALAVSGSILYAGGEFTTAGTVTANHIAQWNGSAWSALGMGVVDPNPIPPHLDSGAVYALAVSGSNLYVGGRFSDAGGGPDTAANLVRWNGSTFVTVGGTTGCGLFEGFESCGVQYYGTVRALAVSGTDVYVGGDFTTVRNGMTDVPNTAGIAKVSNGNFSALGSGIDYQVGVSTAYSVYALAVSGTVLTVGGDFAGAGGEGSTRNLAKWTGSAWSRVVDQENGPNAPILALAVNGPDLYIAGSFTATIDFPANRIAKKSGASFTSLTPGMNADVYALAIKGTDVYAGGSFVIAGNNTLVNHIAKWNGSTWSKLGNLVQGGTDGTVRALLVNGTDLYAGGDFLNADGIQVNCVAKWDGNNWSALGSGVLKFEFIPDLGGGSYGDALPATVYALAVDNNNRIYVGGDFSHINGYGAPGSPNEALFIARWVPGPNVWEKVGSGNPYGVTGPVYALAGSGSTIYVGGKFSNANGPGGPLVSAIAKFVSSAGLNGTWSALGGGVTCANVCQAGSQPVYALALSGTDLYAGGDFDTAVNSPGGNVPNTTNIAKWNGSAWSALGTGMNDTVNALAVGGNNLYAGGIFSTAGGVSANKIAQWNNSAWSPLGSGTDSTVQALAAGPSILFVGGHFIYVGGGTTLSPFVAGYTIATPTPTPTPTPATVKVKVGTSPVGRTFSVDGTTYSSQQRFTWVSGSSHTIATTSPQSGGSGVQYVWKKWNDNGAISHVVAPTTNKTYTARFQTQYFLTMSAGAGGAVQPASSWRNAGSSVVIKARTNPGHSFTGWIGSGMGSYTGTNNPVSIMMNGPITETGNFSP